MTTDFKEEYEEFKKNILYNNPNADIGLIKKSIFFW